ncbi:MAG: DUF6166 domain-containing protein [Hyphomicrobiaceae bacterium]
MKVYKGDRTIDGILVTVDDELLGDAIDIKPLCRDGFEWGFEGPASAQLALAILHNHLDDTERSIRLYQPFMREIVANFANEWVMTSHDIDDAIADIEAA